MKINKYQLVVLTWGFLTMIGYILTDAFLSKPINILIVWTAVISIGLFVQASFMWYERTDGYLTHLVWLLINISGGIATYLKFYGIIDNPILITTMWFMICAVGMFVTAFLQKNMSYVILGVLYSIAAVVFQLGLKSEELIVAGVIFAILGIVDAGFEYSPFRSHLADFEEERVI